MKRNLTVQLDEETVRRAKVLASARDTSVSRLVADQIEALVARDDEYDAARRRFSDLTDRVQGESGGRRWSRDELHERAPGAHP